MSSKFIKQILTEGLIQSDKRLKSSDDNPSVLLNRNESPYDIETEIKDLIYKQLSKIKWNRYPPVDNKIIEEQIANYCGVDYHNVVVSPGSANLITSLLDYFAINKKKIHIASPSFSLYEYHCKTYNIPYYQWLLTDDLEYDINKLEGLTDHSIVLFASPNNPVGNTLPVEKLEYLAKNNPNALFIVDEVYEEYSNISYLDILKKYPNMISIRSFSKTLSAAGVRLGYLIGAEEFAEQIRKLILPFSLNIFTQAFAEIILRNTSLLDLNKIRLQQIVNEREKVYLFFSKEYYKPFLSIKKSQGNFLLISFTKEEYFKKFMNCTRKSFISVLDVSGTPKLENSIRLTIGTPEENESVINCVKNCF